MNGNVIPYSEPDTPIGYSRQSRVRPLRRHRVRGTGRFGDDALLGHAQLPHRESILFAAVYVAAAAPLVGVTLAVMARRSKRDRTLVRTGLWMNFIVFVALMLISFIFRLR